ncbi:MAG TPA: delta-60 repeat domain-containing protein, partial [Pyrinomonadaceae bacterium]|nr:delta-60 repeat domain-containing protein [Pyrinomonadaceae bacterium]
MNKFKKLQTILCKIGFALILGFIIISTNGLVHAADGDVDVSFQGSALRLGTVYTTAVQPDGKILIGGDFYAVNGMPRRALARLNADGSLDTTFQANVQGIVYSISVQPDGKIFVGGTVLLNLSTRQRLNFFRLNANGTSDDAFNAGEGITGGTVYAIVPQPDGKILVGGDFDGINGSFRSGILRINADGSWDSAFSGQVYGDSFNEGIYGMALQEDGKIVIAGDFNNVNNTQRVGIARLNSDGTLDTSFNGGITSTNRRVWGLALQPDNKIIICGFFNQVNGVTKNQIARFNTNGSLDTSFVADIPTALYTARTVRLQADGRIFVGGFFAQINGTPKNNIARLFSNGTLDTSFTAGTDGTVYDITPLDNPIFVGGFTKFNNADSLGVSRT